MNDYCNKYGGHQVTVKEKIGSESFIRLNVNTYFILTLGIPQKDVRETYSKPRL